MKNAKTTIFGFLAAIFGFAGTQPGTMGTVGQIGTAIFTTLLGAAAKDSTNKN
jgi:hypothetical protein